MFEEMSTAINHPNNSRINNRQSRVVIPTPSPTSGPLPTLGPVHAHSVNLRSPSFPVMRDETLQQAIQEYVGDLSDDDKAAFQSAPDIMKRIQGLQDNGKLLISSPLMTRVENVLQCVKSFMGSLAIFIQHSPQISSLVIGGVNCILTVGTLCSSWFNVD